MPNISDLQLAAFSRIYGQGLNINDMWVRLLSRSGVEYTATVPDNLNIKMMSSPPTIGASTASSAPNILWSNAAFRYSGGIIAGRNANAFGYNAMTSTLDANARMVIDIMLECSTFDVVTGGVGPTGGFRVWINDEMISQTPTAATENDGAYHKFTINLGSRQVVRVTVELGGTGFGGINIGATDAYWRSRTRRTKAIFVGDSITNGSVATNSWLGFPTMLAQRMGWENMWNAGQSGTGYLAPGSGGGRTAFLQRMQVDVYNQNPDVIVLAGGTNDILSNNAAYTPAAVQAAVTVLLADIAANCPLASNGLPPRVYVVGPFWPSRSTDWTNANSSISAACALATNVTNFIDATTWVTGTGKVGATTGVGNADWVVSADGVHPTDEGHKLIAARMAESIYAG